MRVQSAVAHRRGVGEKTVGNRKFRDDTCDKIANEIGYRMREKEA
jgi:hypothetical protein